MDRTNRGRDESDGEESERMKKTKEKIKEIEGKSTGKNPKEGESPGKSRAAQSETKHTHSAKEKSERSGDHHKLKRVTAKEGTSAIEEKEIRQKVTKYKTVSDEEEGQDTEITKLKRSKKKDTDKKGVKIDSPRKFIGPKDSEDTAGDIYEVDSVNPKYKIIKKKKDGDSKQVASTSFQGERIDISKRVERPDIDYKYKEKITKAKYATSGTQEGRDYDIHTSKKASSKYEAGTSPDAEIITDTSGHETARTKGISLEESGKTEISHKKKEKRDLRGVRIDPKSRHVRTRDDKDDIGVSPKHKKIKTKHDESSLSEEERTDDIFKYKTVKKKELKEVVQVTPFDIRTGIKNVGAIEAECKKIRIKEVPSTSAKPEVEPIAEVSKLIAAKRPETVKIKEGTRVLREESKNIIGTLTTENDEELNTRTENVTESMHYDPKYKLVDTGESFEIGKGSDVDLTTCLQIRTTDGSTYEEREDFGFKYKYAEASTSTKQHVVPTREIESQVGLREIKEATKESRHQSDVSVGTGTMKDACKQFLKEVEDTSKPPKTKSKQVQTKEKKTKKAKTEESSQIKIKEKKKTEKTRDDAANIDDYRDEICRGPRESKVKEKKDKPQRKKSKSPVSKEKGRRVNIIQKETAAGPSASGYDEGALCWPEETDDEKGYKTKEKSVGTDSESGLIARKNLKSKRKQDKLEVKKIKSEDIGVGTDDMEIIVEGKSVSRVISRGDVEDVVEKCKSAMEKIIQLEEKIKEIGVGIENIEEEGRSIRSLRELPKVEQGDVAVGTGDTTSIPESIKRLPTEIKVTFKEMKKRDEMHIGTDDSKEKICKKYKSDLKKSRARDLEVGTREKTKKRDVELRKKTKNVSVGTEDIKYKPKKAKKHNKMKELMKLMSQTEHKAVGTSDVVDDKDNEPKIKDKSVGTKDEPEVIYSKKDEIKIRKQIEKIKKKIRKKIKTNDASVDTYEIEEIVADDQETSEWEPMILSKDMSVGTSDREEEKQSKAIGKRSKEARLYFEKLKRTLRPIHPITEEPRHKEKEILRRSDHKDLWLGEEDSDTSIKKLKLKQHFVKPVHEKKEKVRDKPPKKSMKDQCLSCINGCFKLPKYFLLPGQKREQLRFLDNMVFYRACLNVWATCVMILEVLLIFYLGLYWFRNACSWSSILAAYYFNETLVIGLKNSNDPHHIKAVKRLNDIKERRRQDSIEEKKPKKKSNVDEGGGFFPEAELEESESEVEHVKKHKKTKSKSAVKWSKRLRKTKLWLKKALKPSLALIHTILVVIFVAHSIVYSGLPNQFVEKMEKTNEALFIYNILFGIIMIIDTFMALFPIKLIYLIVPFIIFGIQIGVCKLILLIFSGTNEYFETFINTYDPRKYDEQDWERVVIMIYIAIILWIISIPRYYINNFVFRKKQAEPFQSEREREEYLREEYLRNETLGDKPQFRHKTSYKLNKKLRKIQFPILV